MLVLSYVVEPDVPTGESPVNLAGANASHGWGDGIIFGIGSSDGFDDPRPLLGAVLPGSSHVRNRGTMLN